MASNAATKVLLTQILKQIAGKSAGIITGIVNPSTINTPYDAFIASLERICKISNERPFDWESFNLELENLQIAAEGVEIEKHFGNNNDCYNDLKFIVDTHVLIGESAKKLQL